jgi:hypothetical protein
MYHRTRRNLKLEWLWPTIWNVFNSTTAPRNTWELTVYLRSPFPGSELYHSHVHPARDLY